jgi:cytoskeleton protein RodZ
MKAEQGGSADAGPTGAATSAKAAAAAASPGQMLKQERERRGLSLQEAAEQLNLDRWIVEAIEVDHFLALGAPVYARGHLRKYAALLELSQDLVVDCYDALTGTPTAPVVTSTTTARMPRRARRRERARAPWGRRSLWLLLLLVLLAAGWWFFLRHDTAAVATSVTRTIGGPAPAVIVAPPVAAVTTSPTISANQPAAVTSNQVSLQLAFTAPAFVEVEDAAGQRLMFENGRPGQTRELHGAAPLEVIISVAAAVNVKINDRAIVMPRLAGKDATRFSIDANGTVR